MSSKITLTVVGNLTSDPELRHTAGGTPVTNFTVASTERVFDGQTGKSADGETIFMRCVAWRDYAENICASLARGQRVVVSGRLKQRKYRQTPDSDERTSTEIEVDAIGPDLRWATAQVTKIASTRQQPAAGSPWPSDEPSADAWPDSEGQQF